MAQDVVTLVFPGDADALLPRYAEGARRWQAQGGTAPEQCVLSVGEAGLTVTLVWGVGVSHAGLGKHMVGLLEELGLPFPQVSHGVLASSDWDQVVAVAR